MRKLYLVLLLGFVLIAGIIAGVELHGLSLGYSCPQAICVEGSRIKPVTDREYFSEAHSMIQGSKSSIHMVEFELKYYKNFQSSLENQLVKDLIDARKRGVEVKILVDDFSEDNNAFDILKENGIDVKLDSENVTTHAKLIVVDGRIVLIGSTNLSYFALEKNNEANVVIEDEKTAREFEDYFRKLWAV